MTELKISIKPFRDVQSSKSLVYWILCLANLVFYWFYGEMGTKSVVLFILKPSLAQGEDTMSDPNRLSCLWKRFFLGNREPDPDFFSLKPSPDQDKNNDICYCPIDSAVLSY